MTRTQDLADQRSVDHVLDVELMGSSHATTVLPFAGPAIGAAECHYCILAKL